MSKSPAQEIEQALRAASASSSDIEFLQHYMGTRYPMIGGLPVPVQRAIAKKGFSFSGLPVNEQLEIWDGIWNSSNVFEVMTQCLLFVQKNLKKLDRKKAWSITRGWVKKTENWGHSDMLSGIFAWLLEQDEGMIHPQLVKWNASREPWERRQSLVSLFEYSSRRERVLPVNKVLPLVENLLDDDHKFVQKAVGWTLRETGNVYPQQALQFLQKHHARLSPIAFSAAVEKLDTAEKENLKSLRKAARSKP